MQSLEGDYIVWSEWKLSHYGHQGRGILGILESWNLRIERITGPPFSETAPGLSHFGSTFFSDRLLLKLYLHFRTTLYIQLDIIGFCIREWSQFAMKLSLLSCDIIHSIYGDINSIIYIGMSIMVYQGYWFTATWL